MPIQISKLDKSLAVRIPRIYAKALALEAGMEIEITRLKGGSLLSPKQPSYTLEGLLARVKPENRHNETQWGAVNGRELW
jgi:antitoxin MazE